MSPSPEYVSVPRLVSVRWRYLNADEENSVVAPAVIADRTSFARRLKSEGRYFFETPFDAYDGASATVAGRRLLMFSSYSYLGLIGHPEVNEAASRATERYGSGCHGARLIAGTTKLHQELEDELAAFVGAEASIVFNTGYVTNLATIAALVGPGDVVIGDEYNHASLMDGARFSGAEAVTFRHSDLRDLERRLAAAGERAKLVVVDAVYSMEGDIAPVPEIAALCDRYDALLMVDEAHSIGVLGSTGRGVQEHFGLSADAIDVKMGTLSKSLGSCGGYIGGRADLVEYLKHAARGSVFSGAMPPPQVAAALTAIRILQREPERVAKLHSNTHRLISGLRGLGLPLTDTVTPIVPVLCGTEERTLSMTAGSREAGLFAIPIFYPAVPMNAPRIRLSVIASLSERDIDTAVEILGRVGRDVGLIK